VVLGVVVEEEEEVLVKVLVVLVLTKNLGESDTETR
jgi:hypothetical protein